MRKTFFIILWLALVGLLYWLFGSGVVVREYLDTQNGLITKEVIRVYLVKKEKQRFSSVKDITSPVTIAQTLTNGLIGAGFGVVAGVFSSAFKIDNTFFATETQMTVNNAFVTFVSDGLLGVTSSLYADVSDQSINAVSSFFDDFSIKAVQVQQLLE